MYQPYVIEFKRLDKKIVSKCTQCRNERTLKHVTVICFAEGMRQIINGATKLRSVIAAQNKIVQAQQKSVPCYIRKRIRSG